MGWIGETAAHWRWETDVEAYLPYLRRSVRPLDGDLWVTDVYTHPSYRRRGLYTTATAMAMHRARARGHTRLIGLIARWNRPALRVAETGSSARLSAPWATGRSPLAAPDHDRGRPARRPGSRVRAAARRRSPRRSGPCRSLIDAQGPVAGTRAGDLSTA